MISISSNAVEKLREFIRALRSESSLGQIMVIVPSPACGLYLRRRLAADGGLANVQFVELKRIAELLGGPVLAAEGRGPMTPLRRERIVKRLLVTSPGVFAPVVHHMATVAAVAAAVGELGQLSPVDLANYGRGDDRRTTLAALTKLYRRASTQWYETYDLVRAATNAPYTGGRSVAFLLGSLSEADTRLLRHISAASIVQDDVRLESLGHVQIFSVPDAAGEVRVALGEVADAIESGVHVGQIAVVFPSRAPWLRIVVDECAIAEIPIAGQSPLRYSQSLAGRTLLSMLELGRDNFDRNDVSDWLLGGGVRTPVAGQPAPAAAWARHAQQAGVTRGQKSWEARLRDRERLLAGKSSFDEANVGAFGLFMTRLIASCRLAGVASAADWSRKVGALLGEFVDVPAGDAGREAIETVLGSLGDLGDDPMTAPEFVSTLRRELAGSGGRIGSFGSGVFVGTIAETVGVTFSHVVVMGVTETDFGRALRASGVFPHSERIRCGLAASEDFTRYETSQQLASLLGSAERASVTFGRADARAGRACMPAPFLVDLVNAAHSPAAMVSGLSMANAESSNHWLTVVPSRHADLYRVHSASSVFEQRLRSAACGAVFPDAAGGRTAFDARASAAFTEFDGALGEKLGVDVFGKTLSATTLETFAACPRRYFLERVLGLKESEPLQETEDLSPLDHGSLVHDVLDQLFTQGPSPKSPTEPWSSEARESIPGLVDGQIERLRRRGHTGERLPMILKRDDLVRTVNRILNEDDERRNREAMVQVYSEYGFGPTEETPLQISLPDGRQLTFQGKVDRIDLSLDGAQCNVIDYKTGAYESATALEKEIASGLRLQLPIYALAAQALYPHASVSGRYWFVSEGADFRATDVAAGGLLPENLTAVLGELVAGLESGTFPARPGRNGSNCSYCRVVTGCDADRERQWQRKCGDDQLARYVALVDPIAAGIVDADGVDH